MALLDGDPAGAERLYEEALERADPHWVKSVGTRVRTLAGLGRTAEARGDRAAARARYRAAAEAASGTGADTREALHLLGLPANVAERVVEAVSAR